MCLSSQPVLAIVIFSMKKYDLQLLWEDILSTGEPSTVHSAPAVFPLGQSRGGEHLSCTANHALCHGPQGPIGLLGHQCSLLTHSYPVVKHWSTVGQSLPNCWPPGPPEVSLQSSFPATHPTTCTHACGYSSPDAGSYACLC